MLALSNRFYPFLINRWCSSDDVDARRSVSVSRHRSTSTGEYSIERAGYSSRNGIFIGGRGRGEGEGRDNNLGQCGLVDRSQRDRSGIPGLPRSSTKDLEDPTITAEDGETRSLLSVHAVDSDAAPHMRFATFLK